MKENLSRMLRSGVALLLVFCMVVGFVPTAVFATGTPDDGFVHYVSLGASNTNGYGLDGYLPEAVINDIAHLGWCPKDNQEIFTIDELEKAFFIEGISKSPSIFDYDKLEWFNGEYIKNMTVEP